MELWYEGMNLKDIEKKMLNFESLYAYLFVKKELEVY